MSTMAVKSVPIAVAPRKPSSGRATTSRAPSRSTSPASAKRRSKQLQRAIAANEASPEIYRAMGHIQFEMGDYEEAAKTLPPPHPDQAAIRHGMVQPGRLAWSG